jgi:ketosteroid isomerase-like protein
LLKLEGNQERSDAESVLKVETVVVIGANRAAISGLGLAADALVGFDRYYDAWSKLNTDAADEFYAKDADCVFFDVAPLKYTKGWEEYKAGVQRNFFDTATSAKLTPNDDLKVTRRGNVAWTTVTLHVSVKEKSGADLNLECRHTAIWEKRGGKWLIVHEHVSAPLQG